MLKFFYGEPREPALDLFNMQNSFLYKQDKNSKTLFA
jgi:hypothetical protein